MYRVDVTHIKDYEFAVRSGAHELIIDAKAGAGLTPPDALLASLGSCIGVYIQKYLDGAKLAPGAFKITVEAEFAKDPLSFKLIKIEAKLGGIQLDDKRKTAFLEFIKNCPVHNTLKGSPRVEVKLS